MEWTWTSIVVHMSTMMISILKSNDCQISSYFSTFSKDQNVEKREHLIILKLLYVFTLIPEKENLNLVV